MDINWLPTTITVVLIAIAARIFLWRWKKMDETFLTKESHEKLCRIAQLEFQNHIKDVITDLKENYLEGQFKSLIETIEKNNK